MLPTSSWHSLRSFVRNVPLCNARAVTVQRATYMRCSRQQNSKEDKIPPAATDDSSSESASGSKGEERLKDGQNSEANKVEKKLPLIESSTISEIIEQIKARAGFTAAETDSRIASKDNNINKDDNSINEHGVTGSTSDAVKARNWFAKDAQQSTSDSPSQQQPIVPAGEVKRIGDSQMKQAADSVKQSRHTSKSPIASGTTSPTKSSNNTMKPTNSNSIGSNIGSTLHYAEQTYEDFELKLMHTINESNKRRFRIILLSTLLVTIWIGAVFGDRIRKEATEQTAALAKETLENESLQIQTQELARAVVQTVLEDKDINSNAATFLKAASSAPETQQALLQLTLHILQHQETLEELTKLSKRLLNDLCEDKEVIQQFGALFAKVVEDPVLKEALVQLVADLCKDPAVLSAVNELTLHILGRKDVNQATNELLLASSSEVLDDREIKLQSRKFVADVMGDDLLQREGGTALWNTISHALQPGLWRMAGLTLITFSLALAKVVLTPY